MHTPYGFGENSSEVVSRDVSQTDGKSMNNLFAYS
jgi:hypothetical protein